MCSGTHILSREAFDLDPVSTGVGVDTSILNPRRNVMYELENCVTFLYRTVRDCLHQCTRVPFSLAWPTQNTPRLMTASCPTIPLP